MVCALASVQCRWTVWPVCVRVYLGLILISCGAQAHPYKTTTAHMHTIQNVCENVRNRETGEYVHILRRNGKYNKKEKNITH